MNRKEIGEAYNVVQGFIRSPGQFEGEAIYAPYFWDEVLNGCAEDFTLLDGETVSVLEVSDDDRKEFPELEHVALVALSQSDQGFIYLKEFSSAEEYEAWRAGIEGADEDPSEPEEEDWVTSDHKAFTQNGKRVLTLTGEESPAEMWVQIRRAMSDANYWPNVWFISDHGNAHLMKEED